MPKIIFFTKSVSVAGGKERVLINLANYLASIGLLTEIVTYDGSIESTFSLNNSIKITTLSISFLKHGQRNNIIKLWHFFRDVRAYRNFRKDIQPCDQIVVTDQVIATIARYAFSKNTPNFIIWEHLSFTNYLGTIWELFVKRIYPRAKLVVALSKEEELYYKNIGCTTVCIPNAIASCKQSSLSQGGPFVWVGSLTKEKGIEDIIEIGKRLSQNSISIKIQLYGAGPLEDYLKQTIYANSLENILVLKGLTKDVSAIYGNAYALIVTSKHECFPTVILEAFSYGIPVIAYDCPTGPRNIITQGENGFLIMLGDIENLYHQITNLTENYDLAKKMGADAFASSHNYRPAIVYPQWEKILNC